MHGSYRMMADSIFKLIAYQDDASPSEQPKRANYTSLNYKNFVFMYHDKKRAVNKDFAAAAAAAAASSSSAPIGASDETHKAAHAAANAEASSSHCYFSLYAIKSHFVEESAYFARAWISQTSHLAFNEELNPSRAEFRRWLITAANDANGKQQQQLRA